MYVYKNTCIYIYHLYLFMFDLINKISLSKGLNSTSKGRKGGCTETSGFIDHQLGLECMLIGCWLKPNLYSKIVAWNWNSIYKIHCKWKRNGKYEFGRLGNPLRLLSGTAETFCSCGEILCESQCPSHSRSFLNMCLFQHKSTKQKKKSIQNSQVQWIFQIKHSISSNARRHQFEPLPWCLLWDPRTWTFCWCGICCLWG